MAEPSPQFSTLFGVGHPSTAMQVFPLRAESGCCLQALLQGLSAPAPQHVGGALALAHFLDHMYHHRPAKRVEASPWYEAASSLVQDLLSQTVKNAPKVGDGRVQHCTPGVLTSKCGACLA